VGEGTKGRAWLHGIFPGDFDLDYKASTRHRAGDVWVHGWFTDNELRRGGGWRGSGERLTMFLDLPASAPGKKAAAGLLQDRHCDVTGRDVSGANRPPREVQACITCSK